MIEKNDINEFFVKKIAKMSASPGSKEFSFFQKKGGELSRLGVDCDKKFESYFLIKKAAKNLKINLSNKDKSELIKMSIDNMNDAYYAILSKRVSEKNIKKVAYPNFSNYMDQDREEFDINKWLKTVHLIYDAVSREEMTKENALDYYSNFLDIERDEDLNFKKWFKYYSDGEHLKYSEKEEDDMKKNAVYMSNMGQSSGAYSHSGGSHYLNKNTGFNMPGDSFGEESFDEVSSKAEKKVGEEDAFNSWKGKLHSAIRRIDKLMRSDKYMRSDTYKVLAEYLLNLSHQVHCLKLASTLTDVTYKTAGAFSKHGEQGAADILLKIAQEIPEEMPEEMPGQEAAVPEEAAVPGQEAAVPGQEAAAPSEEEAGPMSGIPAPEDVESAKLEDITPIPGARPGEYDELAGDISLDDAATKLDEVAGMLADRRIIRQLAEFDIMLDKIGIASMFPELAESQSKLIDAYSYALTRVTKMMGQLANAKSIINSKNNLPGTEQPLPEEVPEEALEAPEETPAEPF